MKLEEGVTVVSSATVTSGERQQRLVVESGGTLALLEGAARLRSWPLHIARLRTDLPNAEISVEMGGEIVKWICSDESNRAELARAAVAVTGSSSQHSLSEAELGALLEDAELDEADAERRVQRLGEKLAQLDALNVGGMLAAATEGGGAKLASRLEEGASAGAALSARAARLEALTRAAGAALHARSGAARADASARALLAELSEIYAWLDAPALAHLDDLQEISLASADGRARALAAAEALRGALRAERSAPAGRLRLAAVRERLRRLARARDQLAAALARHLNNALIHLANEAHAPLAAAPAAHAAPAPPAALRRHHAELQPYAPFMRWLKEMDEKAYDALVKVYVGTWSKVYERELGAASAPAPAPAPAPGPAPGPGPGPTPCGPAADRTLSDVLTLVETICNAEQDFCTHFFALDVDTKAAEGGAAGGAGGAAGAARRMSGDTRRLMGELFPALDAQLGALLAHAERDDP